MKCIPDTHKFKVICQRCGKTGIIDMDKTSDENGFVLEIGIDGVEYYLCLRCHKICKDNLLKKIEKNIEFRLEKIRKMR